MGRFAGLLLGLAAGCAGGGVMDEVFGPGGETLRGLLAEPPPEHRDGAALLLRRCTRCHTLDPVFAAHVPAGSWIEVVGRMARRPGAGIPDADRRPVAGLLEHLSELRRGVR